MIIYGASGHAKVIIDILNSMNCQAIDFVIDDDPSIINIKGLNVCNSFTEEMIGMELMVAIGNNGIRKKIVEKVSNPFIKAIVHPSAIIFEDIKIGNGSVVMPNATINSSSIIGDHCIINTGAIIEHDANFSDFVHISPGATITGNVNIGEGTQIGAGATVIPGVSIGKWVTVGAGAVIINDIPDYAVVVGSPGKIIKYNRVENE
jgi:sugar O-acyltransferase (sialic acid O-acetyltransferase NeuD family)